VSCVESFCGRRARACPPGRHPSNPTQLDPQVLTRPAERPQWGFPALYELRRLQSLRSAFRHVAGSDFLPFRPTKIRSPSPRANWGHRSRSRSDATPEALAIHFERGASHLVGCTLKDPTPGSVGPQNYLRSRHRAKSIWPLSRTFSGGDPSPNHVFSLAGCSPWQLECVTQSIQQRIDLAQELRSPGSKSLHLVVVRRTVLKLRHGRTAELRPRSTIFGYRRIPNS
jgi:hypothetical protein